MDKQQKPLISIIMPSFNSEEYLARSIGSVLNQTFSDWELLICDDCSSDSSYFIAKTFEEKDDRIHVLKNNKNSGTSFSRNELLKIASGRYISFLDSDDEMLENYLQSQISFIKGKDAAMVSSGYFLATKTSKVAYLPPAQITYKLCCRGNPLGLLSTIYDTEKVGHPLFDQNFKKSEDWVYWLDMLKKGAICYGNQKTLAIYNIHDGSKNSKKLDLIKYNYRVFRKSQNMNPILSILHVIQWAFYGIKKYKEVR